MVDQIQHTRPVEQGLPHEHVRETTVVNSRSGTGVMAAFVLFVLLAVAGYIFWTTDENVTANTAAPGAEINEQVAPAPASDPARPVPTPEIPAELAPAETTPAPSIDG